MPLRELLTILRRRRRVIFWVVVPLSTVAGLIGLQVTKTYTATAQVMLEPEGDRVVNFEEVAQGLSAGEAAVETQISFIQSRENLARALENLRLYANAEFVPQDGPPLGSLGGPLGASAAWLPDAVAERLPDEWLVATGLAKDSTTNDDSEPEPWELRERAIAALAGSLEVAQAGRSHVLSISFTSTSPDKAARIANWVAESYLESQVDEKLSAIERANSWLAERVEALKQDLLEAEMAVAEYRGAKGLFGSGDSTLGAQELAALTAQSLDASAESAAKWAKLQRVRRLQGTRNGYESVAEVLSSPMVMSLRQQEAQLLRERAILSREYGVRHPNILQIEIELANLRDKIDQELQNAVASLENEVAVARSREQALKERLREAKGDSALTGQAEVRLRDFEREAAASRRLYETFLTRLKETEEQQRIVQADARIISPAQVPDSPSSPSPMLFATVGLTASVVLGTVLALLREQLDSSIRSGRHVEELLQIPALGLVPKVAGLGRDVRLHEYLSDKPHSSYAEGVRGLYMQAQPADVDHPPKLILVTSALPGEGKTTLAVSLAAFAAAGMQQRTLLIDLDLRRPMVAREFRLRPERDLLEVVSGEARLDDAVYRDEATGLDVLAGGTRRSNPTALLTSQRIGSILRHARDRYDFVVIDTMPVLGVTDAKALLPQVDTAVFVIQWERTKADAARAALKELKDVAPNVLGAVLNQVNLKRHAYYGYGDAGQYYHKYNRYYND